ncbi:MAG TPA: Flp pilus assembly protein CpaB [Bryobacteraceae bacterium]|nr:Flp pilus assembly protein CpaB [Bryobacteraceae bacterium]
MDRRFLVVLGLSLIVALIISTIFYRITAGAGSAKRPDPGEQKDIVLAAKPLSVGTTIKASDLRLGKMPADQYPKGAFAKIEEVIDRPVVSNILLDEAVLEGRLADRGSGIGLAPTIPVGMRAVTVRVTDVAGVAGFVLPGLRVDVLVTGRPPDEDGQITATCLQNMLVLSSGQTMQADPRGQPINTPTVTLLATPEQAEILTLAGNSGSIQLVLRNGSDTEIQKTPGRQVAELYGKTKIKPVVNIAPPRPRPRPAAVEKPVVAPPPPPPPPEVIVIRGNTKSVERVAN